jgi:C-terminal processing protease CtpA/Prc
VGEFSRVEILPLSQLHRDSSSNNSSAGKANNGQQKSSSKSLVDLNKEYRLVDMQKFGSLNSCSASLNTNQVCHPERVDVTLRADENGTFGFTLQGASIVGTTHDLAQNAVPLYPVIGYVEPNSVAERCGILQPGDRILSVNKHSLEALSLEEARQIIKDAGSNLNLEIEFDVAGKAKRDDKQLVRLNKI